MNPRAQENDEALVVVARAVKTRGLKGELIAELLTDFPNRFASATRLFAIGPDGERTKVELESHSFQNKRVVLKFFGYDNIDSAKGLIGSEFAVPESDRVQLSENEFYDWELAGCSIQTENGSAIGTVREILRTGGVEVLVVEDPKRKEHLIPMVDSIVLEIDIPRKRILVDPPEGLLEL
jgi:16S rRNA processing protein RimM